MEDWEKKLKDICLSIPIERTQSEVIETAIKYLRLRKGKEVICEICKRPFYANNWRELKYRHCKNCLEKRRKENKEEQELRWEEARQRQEAKEERRIDNFNKGYGNTPATDFWMLMRSMIENDISSELKEMDYYDFLETKYWKVISRYVKCRQNYKCQLCGSKDNLNAHHRNYDRRGKEHKYWQEDLIVLCQDCHEKFHNKGGEEK